MLLPAGWSRSPWPPPERTDLIAITLNRPPQRVNRDILLAMKAFGPDVTLDRELRLANGATLRYTVYRNPNATWGSGGPEADLYGVIEQDGLTIHVSCSDQSDWGPDPRWCIPYLHHVSLIEPSPPRGETQERLEATPGRRGASISRSTEEVLTLAVIAAPHGGPHEPAPACVRCLESIDVEHVLQ